MADYIIDNSDGLKPKTIKKMIDMFSLVDFFKVSENTTMTDLFKQYNQILAKREVEKINTKYNMNLYDCVCNIPVVKTTYNDRTARILDFSDKNDIELASMLGDYTTCCQALGEPGESAMMHGFLNPDAGFFVIEDKHGKVLAQAEIWVENKAGKMDTLVLDNIEFADFDSKYYGKRIETLKNDLAIFAEKVGYDNIILGTGYVDTGFHVEQMEKSPTPVLTKTIEESRILKAACRYDKVYTDTKNSVYMKHNGEVSPCLYGKDRPNTIIIKDATEEMDILF